MRALYKSLTKQKYFWHVVYGLLAAVGWFILNVISGDIKDVNSLKSLAIQSAIAAIIGAILRAFQTQFIQKPEKEAEELSQKENAKQVLLTQLLDHTSNVIPVVEQLKMLDWPSSEDDLALKFVNLRGANLERMVFNWEAPSRTMEEAMAHPIKDGNVYSWGQKVRAYSPSSDWSGANLMDTNLEDAMLFRCNLTGAHMLRTNLRNADISGADLTGAITTGIILEYTKWDENTILPLGEKCSSDEQLLGIANFKYVSKVLLRMAEKHNA